MSSRQIHKGAGTALPEGRNRVACAESPLRERLVMHAIWRRSPAKLDLNDNEAMKGPFHHAAEASANVYRHSSRQI